MVYEAGISVKVFAHYPGISRNGRVPQTEKSADVIVIQDYLGEGQNLMLRLMVILLTYLGGVAGADFERDQAHRGGIARKARGNQ